MTKTDTKSAQADRIVNKYMLGAMGAGLVPIPLVDMIALAGIQLKLVHHLAKLYGIEFSEHAGKSALASLLGGSIPLSFSSNLARFLKSVPFYGQAAGMISMSFLGSVSTYAVGKVFIQHFESGGTFLTFDPHKVSDHYARQLDKGKKKVLEDYAGIKP